MGISFVRYALIIGVLIAICSSLLGVTLVLKRFSFIGDGLSHVAFGAMAVASVLTLSINDVWLSVILSLTVVIVFIFFYNKIFAVTFDEDFAKSSGVNAEAYNLLIAVIVAVVIVLAMNLVGSLLISALVIFPALSAMRVFKNFKSVTICSVILSATCALIGIIISVLSGTPVGSTIVAADMTAFVIFFMIEKISGGFVRP